MVVFQMLSISSFYSADLNNMVKALLCLWHYSINIFIDMKMSIILLQQKMWTKQKLMSQSEQDKEDNLFPIKHPDPIAKFDF